MFMNLLLNAAQSIEGQGSITLRSGKNEGNVWIEISDKGISITPENLGRIFSPSLPPGQGTTFHISLPIWQRGVTKYARSE